jgi:hypothetical protein
LSFEDHALPQPTFRQALRSFSNSLLRKAGVHPEHDQSGHLGAPDAHFEQKAQAEIVQGKKESKGRRKE